MSLFKGKDCRFREGDKRQNTLLLWSRVGGLSVTWYSGETTRKSVREEERGHVVRPYTGFNVTSLGEEYAS